jgi:hypothetical protein
MEEMQKLPPTKTQKRINEHTFVAHSQGNLSTDSVEVTSLEIDTSITNLPVGNVATHGVELVFEYGR